MKLTSLVAFYSVVSIIQRVWGSEITRATNRLTVGRRKFGIARVDSHPSRRILPAASSIEADSPEQSAFPPTGRDFIHALIEDNKDVWDQFVNHPFCLMMGNGTARLDGFKKYMIQDFVFLRSDIRFELGLYYQTEDWSILSTEALEIITRGFEYAKDQLDVCIGDLQIPKATILAAAPARKLKEYIDFQHNALANEDWI
ncbi:hypothetical protein FRC07_007098, partial [Ceratobasidium sp. 392]